MPKFTLTNMVMLQDKNTNKILVLNRKKSFPGIAFPGGHVEKGESIYDSSVREIKEETGYEIRDLKSCGVFYSDHLDGEKYFTYFYKTTEFKGEMIKETDEGEVFWINPEELKNMNLAQCMEFYTEMFFGNHSECYLKQHDNGEWESIFR